MVNSVVPGQFRFGQILIAKVFEEVRIDFLGSFRMACVEQREVWPGATWDRFGRRATFYVALTGLEEILGTLYPGRRFACPGLVYFALAGRKNVGVMLSAGFRPGGLHWAI
jgi:hypothetical protein